MYTLTEIPATPQPFKSAVSGIAPSGVAFSGRYCGVAVKAGRTFLTLSGVSAEAGGTSAKGWLDIPVDAIGSHTFAMTPKVAGLGFDHQWTAA